MSFLAQSETTTTNGQSHIHTVITAGLVASRELFKRTGNNVYAPSGEDNLDTEISVSEHELMASKVRNPIESIYLRYLRETKERVLQPLKMNE
ncbi:MAG: hypothetical protein MK081_14015 [Flavobacteriales bacterium]|nr:hypothetical protein [Flavobacteriales bacterium]